MHNVHVLVNEREEVSQFVILMQMMYSAHKSSEYKILEISYLNKLSNVLTFPGESFTCRDIILSMMERYVAYERSKSKNKNQKNFVYMCQGKSITVGYSMSFYFDVLYICCLHCIACSNICTTPINILINIMTTKYKLNFDYDKSIVKNKKSLTMFRISRSFPSVTINACKVIQSSIHDEILQHFPELPIALLNPYFVYVIPQIYGVPIAIFMYIMILSRENCLNYLNKAFPISTYYNILRYAFADGVFPESFKLQLCKKWQIVTKKNGLYVYAKSLTDYCEKAKNLIRELKKEDSELEKILSSI